MKFYVTVNLDMSVKCMPFQLNHFIQLSVTKDALMDG